MVQLKRYYSKKVEEGFLKMTEINPDTKMFHNDKYINERHSNIDKTKNLYWSINSHIGNRTKRNLRKIFCFGIDIDSRKNGILDDIVFGKINLLEVKYNLSPMCINRTTGGFHVIYGVKEIPYKLYKTIIPSIYDFLNTELGGDIKFKWITGILKIPGSIDVKSKEEIKNIKFEKELRYDIDHYIEIINNYFGRRFRLNKDNDREIKKQEVKDKINELSKKHFYEKVSKLGALTEINRKSDNIEIKNQKGIIDALLERGLIYKLDKNKFIDDHSIQVNIKDNTIVDFANKGRGGVINFLLKYIFASYKNPYKEMLNFIREEYGISRINNQDKIIKLNKFLYKLINGKFFIDEAKIINCYGTLNSDLVNEINEYILNENGNLKGYGLFIFLNILKNESILSNYKIENKNFYEIFEGSYMKKDNIKTNKRKLLKLLEYLSYIKINIESFKTKKKEKNIKEIKELNLITDFEIHKVANSELLNFKLLGGLKGVNNRTIGIKTYINKDIVNIKYKKINLYLMLTNLSIRKGSINITINDLVKLSNKDKYETINLYLEKSRFIKDLKLLINDYFKNKIELTIYKDHINLAYKK